MGNLAWRRIIFEGRAVTGLFRKSGETLAAWSKGVKGHFGCLIILKRWTWKETVHILFSRYLDFSHWPGVPGGMTQNLYKKILLTANMFSWLNDQSLWIFHMVECGKTCWKLVQPASSQNMKTKISKIRPRIFSLGRVGRDLLETCSTLQLPTLTPQATSSPATWHCQLCCSWFSTLSREEEKLFFLQFESLNCHPTAPTQIFNCWSNERHFPL